MYASLANILRALGVETPINTLIFVFGLLFARCLAAIFLTPFLGGKTVPSQVKVALAILLALLVYPSASRLNPGAEYTLGLFIALALKEVFIGVVLGFLAQLVFQAVGMAGELIDTLRGMNQPVFFAPQLSGRVSSLSLFQLQAALAFFFAFNGHLVFVRALGDSFRVLPLFTFPKFDAGVLGLSLSAATLTGQVLMIALQLSAPTLIALFLVDIAFAVLGKAASGIDVHDLSQPWKAIVGLMVVLLTVPWFLERMYFWFVELLHQTLGWLNAL